MNQPLVSIIIPTYNRAHLIGETLDSIIAQTYKNWECIVVDDGSTDATEQLLQEYCKKDSRIQFLHRPSSYGAGGNGARNYGLDQSKGEYVQWFDSDDRMHPKKLELKVAFAKSKQADIIIDEHTFESFPDLPQHPTAKIFKSDHFYVDYILGKHPVITNDVMIKRTVIGKLRFDENLYKAQEYEFFSRLFEQALTYCFINIPLTWYRQSPDGISKQIAKGNMRQINSLIYLSKMMQLRHKDHPAIVAKTQRQGRKTYKHLIKQRKLRLIFQHYQFFKNAFQKNTIVFFLFIGYNYFTGRGFDLMKR